MRRILKVKYELGLFEDAFENRGYLADVGSTAHRDVARQCVRESLVLLKNSNATLPLSKSLAKIIVAGKNADDIGNQCGGWTIDWQGSSGSCDRLLQLAHLGSRDTGEHFIQNFLRPE
ncbi:MAG: glycoside hydrolase family 3 C-terminal domain-containing protein, partial [bacterium]|nr:glycoside hydrolase family 3 C-terminal domain-containing protein [bacterium]